MAAIDALRPEMIKKKSGKNEESRYVDRERGADVPSTTREGKTRRIKYAKLLS